MEKKSTKKELEEKYKVMGQYYDSEFRRLLIIVDKKFQKIEEICGKRIDTENDLSVIMMNPGSSKPKNGEPDPKNIELVDAVPDDTQFQIMKIMEIFKYNYAKIVNLSDYREADSNKIYSKLKNAKDDIYSVFSEQNKEFIKNLNPDSVFIFAWGVSERLSGYSQRAIEVLKELFNDNIKTVGIKHPLNEYGYFHPYQRTQKYRDSWVEIIKDQINNINHS
jgi:hypothetical protein